MTDTSAGFADSVDSVIHALSGQHYVVERGLATAVYLAIRLEKPLLIEGEPGCGKTEIAKALSAASGGELIRLQCYEGLDAATALYEWDYPRQLLTIRLHERDRTTTQLESEIYTERFLLRRPLLRALEGKGPIRPVLLIDELDRADEEFEGLLLEVLSEFQVTVPEIGTIRASTIPLVILTSNRTRELGDAIKRRCLYAYIGYPSAEKEVEILRRKVPELSRTSRTRSPNSSDVFGPARTSQSGRAWPRRSTGRPPSSPFGSIPFARRRSWRPSGSCSRTPMTSRHMGRRRSPSSSRPHELGDFLVRAREPT